MLKNIAITKRSLGLTSLAGVGMVAILLIVIIIRVYKPGAMM
ncbi:MAG TPA: hypothetical protein VFM90_10930 [Cyclobacteriaceae bacterium]|nr:hypothetical protein [Cyclobacteriaceae bacterium]